MTTPLNEIVNVTITRESASISQVGFGTILVLGSNLNTAERWATAASPSDVAKLVHGGTSSKEYAAAVAIFGQSPAPTQIKLGHIVSSVNVKFNSGGMTSGTIKATVNGINHTASGTVKATVMGDLATAIATDTVNVLTAEYTALTDSILITPKTGKLLSVVIDTTAVIGGLLFTSCDTTALEDPDTALTAIANSNNDWYGIIYTSREKSNVMKVAAWTEATTLKYFMTSSSEDVILTNNDTSSVAYSVKNTSLRKTKVLYHSLATTEFLDAGLLGKLLAWTPGSYTGDFKQISTITADNLDSTQRANAFANNASTYEFVGGVNIVRNTKAGNGEWVDVMIFIDWLYARCTEAVYALYVSLKKVPFTDQGINAHVNALENPLKTGQVNGGISPLAFNDEKVQIGGYYFTIPKLSSISPEDKAARRLKGIKFKAFLAGAIHYSAIEGTVVI